MHLARHFNYYDPSLGEISVEEKLLRDKIEVVLKQYLTEMENYCYYGSNPGIPEDRLEDVADAILMQFKVEAL